MQLSDIRNEVYAKGFGTTTFPASRVNQFINDGYSMICRRVDYYMDEASSTFPTTVGTAIYPLPANWARVRELFDATRDITILPTGFGRSTIRGFRRKDRRNITRSTARTCTYGRTLMRSTTCSSGTG